MHGHSSLAAEICCESLGLSYREHEPILEGVNLRLLAGSIISLVGPSGCGKTTLLRLIAGLERPTVGTVRMSPPVSAAAGEISFVFQQPALLPWRSAIENVMLPLELIGGKPAAERRATAEQLLVDVGLADAMHKLPHELSGGMKMRVSIARALSTAPRVMLLDEPFAALDDMLRAQLGGLLLQLWRERRFTAVLVTHNIAEAITLADHIVVMRAGHAQPPIANPLPSPRDDSIRRTPAFGEFYGVVSDTLRAAS